MLFFKTTLVEQLIMFGRFSPGKKRGRPVSSPSGSTRFGSHSPTTTPSSSKSLEFRLSGGESKDLFGHIPKYDGIKETTRCKKPKRRGKIRHVQ